MSGTRHVMIVERNTSGHRLYFVRLLAEAAIRQGDSVTVLLQGERGNDPEVEIHLHSIRSKVSLRFVPEISMRHLARLSIDLGIDHTVVPDGDWLVRKFATTGCWRGAASITLLMVRERGQPSPIPGAEKAISILKSVIVRKACAAKGVRVVLLRSLADRRHVPRGISVATDPTTMIALPKDVANIRASWDLDPTKYWFGILGAISPRKNVAIVARAILSLNTPSVGIIVAGVCDSQVLAESEGVLNMLRTGGSGVRIVNRLLTDLELDAALGAVDCVVLAHSNEGPSGLLGKAAVAGTRVLAAGARSLRHDATQLAGLADWCALDERALAAAMQVATCRDRPSAHDPITTSAFTKPLLESLPPEVSRLGRKRA